MMHNNSCHRASDEYCKQAAMGGMKARSQNMNGSRGDGGGKVGPVGFGSPLLDSKSPEFGYNGAGQGL